MSEYRYCVRCVMRWRAVAGPSASDGNERPPHVGPQQDGRHGDHTTHRATLTRVTRARERKPIAKTAPSGHNGSTIRMWQRGTTSPASWVSLRSPVEQSPRDWRVGKKLLAWERPLRPADREALVAQGFQLPEGDILGVRVADEGVKFALISRRSGGVLHHPAFRGLCGGAGQTGRDRRRGPRGTDHRGLAGAGAPQAGPGVPGRFPLSRSALAQVDDPLQVVHAGLHDVGDHHLGSLARHSIAASRHAGARTRRGYWRADRIRLGKRGRCREVGDHRPPPVAEADRCSRSTAGSNDAGQLQHRGREQRHMHGLVVRGPPQRPAAATAAATPAPPDGRWSGTAAARPAARARDPWPTAASRARPPCDPRRPRQCATGRRAARRIPRRGPCAARSTGWPGRAGRRTRWPNRRRSARHRCVRPTALRYRASTKIDETTV